MLHRLYPNIYSNNQLQELYRQARCGLFHNGMVSGKIIIDNSFYRSLEFNDEDDIKVSPSKLLADIKNDFYNFITELRSNNESRNRFDLMFSNL